MTMRNRTVNLILAGAVALLLAPARGFADDFKNVVKNIESNYHAKKMKIPFLGLAGFLVKVVRPAGVKEFKLAVFNEQNFSPGPQDAVFAGSMSHAVGRKWQPLVRSNSRSSGFRSYVYSQQDGKDVKVLSVVIDRRQAVVLQAKVNPDRVAKFIQNPEFMGQSLVASLGVNTGTGDVGNGRGVQAGSADLGSLSLEEAAQGSKSIGDAGGHVGYSPASGEASFAKQDGAPSLTSRTDGNSSGSAGSAESSVKVKPELASPAQPRDSAPRTPLNDETTARATLTSAPAPEKDVIRLATRLVNLNVRVSDRGGNAIPDLKKGDFTVLEDGAPQDLFHFEPINAPINLVLLLDLSGSTQDSRRVMITTVRKFIDALAPGDRIAIAAFTRKYFVISPFTTERQLLKDRVERIGNIGGGTAYYDAMWTTLDLLDQVKESRKAIVVLTDGIDNAIDDNWTPRHSFDALLDRLQEEDVTVYPIDVNNEPEPGPDEHLTKHRARNLRNAKIAREQLQAVAEQTAGIVFKAASDQDLDNLYPRVAAELHLVYSLAYMPKNSQSGGEFRKIAVKVNRAGAITKTRRGYYAK